MTARVCASLVLAIGFAAGAVAQIEGTPKKNYVAYVAQPQSISIGRQTMLPLRFHVNGGYHVNSHTPKSELLIATTLTLDLADGVTAGAPAYPVGKQYSFSFDPTEKLDVYAGDFTVMLPLKASKGEHTVTGTLHYQACDNAACYPPRSLPIQVIITAR